MNAHTLSTDALSTLGTIIDDSAKRDAIHLAVAPMVARVSMQPGEHVDAAGNVCRSGMGVGVVDPFLREAVATGERFWCVLYPRTITSLRHEWEHPAFSTEAPMAADKAASEAWLRDWITHADCPDYDTVIAAAQGLHVEPIEYYGSPAYRLEDYGDGPNIFFQGRDAHSSIPPEFWDHIEVVTGFRAPPPMRATGFSCSC